MLKSVDISEDINIRESGFGGWYIKSQYTADEIELSPSEMDAIAKYSPLMKNLLDASKLALVELDRIGSDIGFEPDRYRERIAALSALSRAVRNVEGKNAR